MHLLALAVGGCAASLAAAGTLAVPLARTSRSDRRAPVYRRDKTITLDAFNNITGGGYYAQFDIGTPPQTLSFIIDTGSSDVWANSVDADMCSDTLEENNYGYCLPQFDPAKSSTFQMVDKGGFNITYLDGRNIFGDYFNDTVTIGNYKISQQQLGLALDTEQPTGIMGLGFRINEAAVKTYPTIVDNLVSQGYLNARAFSLYLNDIDDNKGIILFGGVDTDKFHGDLATLPLLSGFQSPTSNISSYTVQLQGFDVTVPAGSQSPNLPSTQAKAVLDSGSTTCLLPPDTVDQINQHFGVAFILELTPSPFIDCAWAGAKGNGITLDFHFDGKTIMVPMEEMVVDAFPQEVQQEIEASYGTPFDTWDGVCLFGIGAASSYGVSSSDFAVLGDTFLRSAYVVYDLDNDEVAIAQANLNSTSSNIREFSASASAIPATSGLPSSTAGPSSPSQPSSSPSSSSTGSAQQHTRASSDNSTPSSTASSSSSSSSSSASDHHSAASKAHAPVKMDAFGVLGVTVAMAAVGLVASLF